MSQETQSSTQNSSVDFIEHDIIDRIKPSDMPLVSFGISKDEQLIGCEVTSDGKKLDVVPTQTYDEKGRLTYTKSPDGSYVHYVYSEDKQGRTIGEDKYEHKSNDETGKETIISSKTYGYDHLVGDDTDGKAYLTKEITYQVDQVSNTNYIYEIKEYNWFEAGKCFVLSWQRPGLKVIINIKDDVCEATAWKGEVVNDEWGNWQKIKEGVWNVADNTTIYKDYDASTGKETSKSVVQTDNGYVTTINYKYTSDNSGSWVPTDKTVKTENYNDPWIYDGKHRECTQYDYDQEQQQFVLSHYDAFDWIRQNPNILQHTYKFAGADMTREFEVYDNQGNNKLQNSNRDIYPFKDGRYVIGIEDEKGYTTTTTILYYYNKDGQEQVRYRIKEIENSIRPAIPLEIYQNGKWEKFPIVGDSYKLELGDFDLCPSYEFNKDGYVTKNQEYDSDGGYLLTYNYTDDGYTKKRQDSYDGPDTYELTTCYIDTEGTYNEEKIEYEDGEKDYGYKRTITADGIESQYYWSDENKGFEIKPSSIQVIPMTTEKDGINTTVYRELQDGKVVETSKTEKKSDENSNTTITYNKVGNEWQPESKTEQSSTAKPQFALTLPSSTIKALNSSALISDVDSTFFTDKSNLSSSLSYSWNTATGSWNVNAVNEAECKVEGNTLTYTIKSYNGTGYNASSTRTYTRDDENRLIQYTEENVTPVATRASQSSTLTKDFEYDKKGRLASVTITTDHVEKYVMNYGDDVTGIQNVTANPASSTIHISIVGKQISVDGSKNLTLYTLDGKKVASSLNDKIEAPSCGAFIVVADNLKVKILVK